MSTDLIAILVVPTCFVLAGLLGRRLGTPPSIATGLIAVGACHLVAFLLANRAQGLGGTAADALHVAAQVLFVLGFGALLWIAEIFPVGGRPSRITLVVVSAAALGPVLGGFAASTPSVTGGTELGPIAAWLPAWVAGVAGLPIALLPLAAAVVFAVRLARAQGEIRRMMLWPVAGLGVVAMLALVGVILGPSFPGAASVAFLLAAPVVPFSVAFGPVRYRLASLTYETDRLNSLLLQQVSELEASRRRLAAATENERRRIERNLHDGAQQELLALMTHAEIAASTTDAADRDAALEKVAQLGRSAYQTVRGIAHGIRPAVLDDLGLSAAIRGLTESMPISVDLDLATTEPGTFPPEIEGAALFAVSESLANVLRHARASRVRVQLTTARDVLKVEIADDGVGGADEAGSGIRGLRDRVEAAGGTLTVATGTRGTTIDAAFPLGQEVT